MAVIRFAALTALAVWLGGMVAPIWLSGDVACDLGRQTRSLAYVCGGILLVSQFAMKFLGPPPRRFVLRASIAALMLAIVAAAQLAGIDSPAPVGVTLVLGLIQLSWYAHE